MNPANLVLALLLGSLALLAWLAWDAHKEGLL